MIRRAALLLLLALMACAHGGAGPGAQADKGFSAAVSTEEALDATLASRRWALVVGVDEYADPTFDDLRHASRDAEAMAAALSHPRYGAFDRVIRLTGGEEITRDRILFELGRLRADLSRQDTLVLYFSGHGTLEVGPDGAPHLYLVASDSWAADLPGTAIDLDALRRFLASLKPQRKVMILDSCFSGQGKSRLSAVSRGEVEGGAVPWAEVGQQLGQSEAILMASTLGGVAKEDDGLSHGVYTHFLLEALTLQRAEADANKDGAVTTYEAHDFARARTLDHTRGAQIPEGFFRLIGRSEIFLSGQVDAEAARSAALVYAYGVSAERWQIEVDGQSKGTFPGTVAIEGGARQLTVRDAGGRTVARGTLSFAPGQVYTAEGLVEELRGYRRFFGVDVGPSATLGPAEALLGPGAARLGVTSGYRVRGGALRGLSLSFHLGGAVAAAEEGSRRAFDAGGDLMLRRGRRQLQLGVGWQGRATLLPAAGSVTPEDYAPGRWLILSTGPLLWAGYPFKEAGLITLEARGDAFGGSPARGVVGPSALASMRLGVEIGF